MDFRYFRVVFLTASLIAWVSLAESQAQQVPGRGGGTIPEASVSRLAQAPSTEAFLKGVIEQRLRVPRVDSVTKLPFADLYEVRIGKDIIYIDAKGEHLFVGNIINTRTRENLTKARSDALLEASLPKVKFADLPLDSAIKFVKGNGKRQLVVFSDPNCSFCKRLEKTLEQVSDVTIHVFLFPILGPDSIEKSKSIWCSSDRGKAWMDWMVAGTPPSAAGNCSTPVDRLVALGRSLSIDATPTMILANGRRVAGAVPLEEIQKLLGKP